MDRKYNKHYEDSVIVKSDPVKVFVYSDDHTNFSSHMNKSSWRMGGGKMNTYIDDKKFQQPGSHLQMEGTVFGIKLYLDEVITKREPSFKKEWETVGKLNLVVIDHYRLGYEIKPENEGSKIRVYIDYDLPKSAKTLWLGVLFGGMYAKWCVNQMINGVKENFV